MTTTCSRKEREEIIEHLIKKSDKIVVKLRKINKDEHIVMTFTELLNSIAYYKNKQAKLKKIATESVNDYDIFIKEDKLKSVLRNFNVLNYEERNGHS